MKINPTLSLFSALILAFIFGFSLSSNFEFPYETNQFSSVLVDNEPLIKGSEQNLASVSSDQIYGDLNNIDTTFPAPAAPMPAHWWDSLECGIKPEHLLKMIANYIEENNDEIFTVIELFDNVVIEFEEETFKGKYAIYTRDDNIIKLTGDVSIESPTRLLTGNELIADIDNNKRILNSANKESLVEVLLENNAND